jgi:hypothetical protein
MRVTGESRMLLSSKSCRTIPSLKVSVHACRNNVDPHKNSASDTLTEQNFVDIAKVVHERGTNECAIKYG